jgi:cyanophycinase-like exopeptidase
VRHAGIVRERERERGRTLGHAAIVHLDTDAPRVIKGLARRLFRALAVVPVQVTVQRARAHVRHRITVRMQRVSDIKL